MLALILVGVLIGKEVTAEPLFPNSVVSNDLDFIRQSDPASAHCLSYQGTQTAEMPDKRSSELMADGVHIFIAKYADGASVGIWVHPSVGQAKRAQSAITPVARAIGQLPGPMRAKLSHVVVHNGDETAFSEDRGRFFVLYSRNIKKRLRSQDLSETVFHEAVHATMDHPLARQNAWRRAQTRDGDFITTYAARNPQSEDMAESALFAWALLKHPGRLPNHVEDAVRRVMPNRLQYFERLWKDVPPTVSGQASC